MWALLRSSTGRIITLLAVSLVVLVAAVPGAPAAKAQRTGAATCAQLGTYTVGSSSAGPLPNTAQGSLAYAAPKPGAGKGSAAAIVYPGLFGSLQGTLTLTGYTGCGGQTAGTFVVHNVVRYYRGIQPMRPGGAPAQGPVAMIMPGLLTTGVLTATGTIAQDTLHAGDPTYLAVTALVVYGRHTLGCPPLCPQTGNIPQACPANGCADIMVVTRTAAFGSVTGFLRVQVGAQSTAGLAFLPPPDPGVASAAAAMQVQPVAFTGVKAGS